MFKQDDKVIVCSNDGDGAHVGKFIEINTKLQGCDVPDVLFEDGSVKTCFGHVLPYSEELLSRLLKLRGGQQFELLTAIKEWNGGKQFIIMRGLPGSGKSTKAKKLAGRFGQVFSADDCFMDREGNYNFNRNKLGYAHKWNQKRALISFDAKIPIIIIDNTNTTLREMRAYLPHIEQAKLRGYQVRIEEPDTHWRFDVGELHKRGTHNVPLTSIQTMLNRYVKDVALEDVLFF